MKDFCGGLNDTQLCAARVSDQRARIRLARDFGKEVNGGADRQRDIDKVGITDGESEFPGKRMVYCAAGLRFARDFTAIPTRNFNVRCIFAQRKREGTADEAGADNGHTLDQMSHKRLYVISF